MIDNETGITYKKCIKCRQYKPSSEYYASSGGTKDKLMSNCKVCQKEYARKTYKKGSKPPKSTQDAINLLKNNGIPAHPGIGLGMPYVDVVAWGCVPIEAKGSKKYDGQYQFGLTPGQRGTLINQLTDGFIMLIAYDDDRDRVFIVPTDNEWIKDKFRSGVTAICVAIDSNHHNSKSWEHIREYENAYHLIEQARIKLSFEMNTHFA